MTEQRTMKITPALYEHLKCMRQDKETFSELLIRLLDAASKYEETLNKTT